MNWIKNNVIGSYKSQIFLYNPISDVCRLLGHSCLVLSSNMDQMKTGANVSFGRRMKYHAMFAIHLLVMIKYAILVKYDDPYTIAMLGESFHVFSNIYITSRMFLSAQMTLLPAKLTVRYIGDQYIADMLVTISQLDTSLPLNRIKNRKMKTKIWLMSKVFNKCLPVLWIIFPTQLLYGLISFYMYSPVPVNLVHLIINSLIQFTWLTNVMELGLATTLWFILIMSMVQLRYIELIHVIKVNKVNGFVKLRHLYNQLVVDIKMCRRIFDPVIGIIYLTFPFLIGFVCQLIINGNWIAKIFALVAGSIGCISNFMIYYMSSSICLMNNIIVKFLHPIQLDKRFKTRQMRLKIDSFIDRLNKEFVGFYCLYAIKFNRMSFYQYILGISTTYFLLSDLANGLQS